MLFIIDERKFGLACATKCKGVAEVMRLAGCSTVVLDNIRKSKPVQPKTLGKLCKVLGVKPEEIIA